MDFGRVWSSYGTRPSLDFCWWFFMYQVLKRQWKEVSWVCRSRMWAEVEIPNYSFLAPFQGAKKQYLQRCASSPVVLSSKNLKNVDVASYSIGEVEKYCVSLSYNSGSGKILMCGKIICSSLFELTMKWNFFTKYNSF